MIVQKRTIFLLIFLAGFFLSLPSAFAVTDPTEGQATPKGIYKCQWIQKEKSDSPNEGACVPSSASNCQTNFKDKCDISRNKYICEIAWGACVSSASGDVTTPGEVTTPGDVTTPGGTSGCTWIGGDVGKDLRDKLIKQGYQLPSGEDGVCGERTTSPTCSAGYKVPDNCLSLGETRCKEAAKTLKSCVRGSLDDSVGKKTDKGTPGGEFQIENPLKAGTVPEILDAVAKFLFAIGFALVTVMVLWGGLQILTAAGNPTQIEKGKKTLLYAVIGTVVILVAGGIADLVGNILGGESGPSPTEIQAPSETNRGSLPNEGNIRWWQR